jgi:hypothetical protein
MAKTYSQSNGNFISKIVLTYSVKKYSNDQEKLFVITRTIHLNRKRSEQVRKYGIYLYVKQDMTDS